MADLSSNRRNSNSQILQELDALSQTLYQSHTARRTGSLALPRDAIPATAAPNHHPIRTTEVPTSDSRPRSRRMSMSPFRSRPKTLHELEDSDAHPPPKNQSSASSSAPADAGEKKGIWNWKPLRALSHMRMQRLGCLFSVEVVAIQGLPVSMNGLRLSVTVRKKETKDGAVQTMPARVMQGSADFEETLFVRCHIYCSGGTATGKLLKFEPRPFLISSVAIDAPELNMGKSAVDLSLMVKESMEKSLDGARIRQWDATFPLSGKARGGELVVKMGFQIMEDGGIGIYHQADEARTKNKGGDSSASLARRQSKFSFSVSSPRITRSEPSSSPSKEILAIGWKAIDDSPLPLPPSSSPSIQKSELAETKADELDMFEFEVVDKGIEIQAAGKEEKEAESAGEEALVSSEVVKEVVHDSAYLTRLTELDAIAKQIKALESLMVTGDESNSSNIEHQGGDMQQLDAKEETVTREFLQMLELEDELGYDMPDLATPMKLGAEQVSDDEPRCFLSDLGKGLGSVVQTRDGGYLASMNPFDVEVTRKGIPKLAMQISRPIVLGEKIGSGIEVFQRLAAIGSEELASKLLSLTAMDEVMGKTAEQVAFEGIASAIISGRSKEGASSSAARSVAVLKTMSTAMHDGRKERIISGIWNAKEEPLVMEEILAFSLPKIEAMAVEALKIQAEMDEEEAPFGVSPIFGKKNPLESATSLDDWAKTCCGSTMSVIVLVVIQLRDPLRRYEVVGGPAIALVQAAKVDGNGSGDEEGRFKVTNLHVGGLKGKRSGWDGDKQRLTAMQWLVAYGLGKSGKKNRSSVKVRGGQDFVWSMSSRVMADIWLKPLRNPDIKINEQY